VIAVYRQKLSVDLEQFTTFGDLLKFLRRRAGLTQRELSMAVGYSHAQISRLELNQRLPDLATISARFIHPLDLEDEPETVNRLLGLAASMRREDAPASGAAPFKGLQYFDEADADLFFGREALVEKLVERVIKPQTLNPSGAADETPTRLLAVVGSSGSGKSSILRAGLIPLLRWNPRSKDWLIYTLTPTAHPLNALAGALTHESPSVTATTSLVDDLRGEPRALHFTAQRILQSDQEKQRNLGARSTQRLVRAKEKTFVLLVIDQFEELFTLCRDATERRAFIENLMGAASQPDGNVWIVLALRADFYAHCAPYTALRQALASQQEYIGPMSPAELQRAIEEPARRGGWELETGLVEVLLKDLGVDSIHLAEPGALPLLSHALLESWHRRRGRMLTISGYLASGGVRGAIAETAEIVFQDELDTRQQNIARSIFLRLTELGDEDVNVESRRRATIDELTPRPEDAAAVREVLTRLADARLIVTDRDIVEVAHEALIREWPTLRGWLEESRDGLRLHRHLTLATEEWLRQGREPADLYRGVRLAQALEWVQSQPDELNSLEREFLQASQAQVEREVSERETQRQRELESARALAETQTKAATQLRRRALYLATALILALGMAVAALFFGQQSRQYAQQALVASRIATTRELASAAVNSLDVDPELGILLALRALSTNQTENQSPLPEAIEALHRALLASHLRLVLSGHEYGVLSAAYSPDGRQIATIGIDGTTKVWDAANGAALLSIPGTTEPSDYLGSQRLAYSPDGRQLVTGDRNLVKLWDANSGAEIASFAGHTGEVWAVAYSPDGSKIASAGVDATARIWDAATGETLLILTGHEAPIEGLAFSPNGKALATAGDDAKLKIWDTVSGELLHELTNSTGPFFSVAYSPDGRYLTAGADGGTKVWEAETGSVVLTIPVAAGNIIFSPDGQRLAGQTGSVAKVWDAQTGQEQLTLAGHADWIFGLAFSPDGTRLVTTSLDRTARVWDIGPDTEFLTLSGTGHLVTDSPEGKILATDEANGSVQLWDSSTGERLSTLSGNEGSIYSLDFSPDGQRLVSGSIAPDAYVWDLAQGKIIQTLSGHSLDIRDVAFSPDGKWIATASFDGTARLWEASTGKSVLTLEGHDGLVVGVAFSPDGNRLATSSTDATAKIWSVPDGELLFTLAGHQAAIPDIAFSPDGTRVATSSRDSTAKVWDMETGMNLLTLSGHRADIWSIAYSPDGRYIATASADNTAKLWDASTGKEELTLPGSLAGVTDVAFTPRDGGAELAVASQDGTVRVYLLRLPELLALAHQRVTRDLTTAECQKYLHTSSCQGGMEDGN
jgi:WD40 repeat protein